MNTNSLAKTPTRFSFATEGWARKIFFKLCGQLQGGELIVEEGRQQHQFGSAAFDGLAVTLVVQSPDAYRRLLNGGSNGAAEAYMDGLWEVSDLTALIRLLLRNRNQVDQFEKGIARTAGILGRIWHGMRRNTRAGAKKNIAAHYDLGNDFFALFLDSKMMYSSAIYQTGEENLDQASNAKLERICRKLDLKTGDHLLEIGTGWGGMAIYAAENYGCQVTTTTISKEQYLAACNKVKDKGLQDRVTLLQQDYRQLQGVYDKVVSIEMVEAVGHQYLETYFIKIKELLKPEGLALIQAITIDDLQYEAALKEVDFIKRFIFPGSFIPCVSGLTSCSAKAGLRLFNLEDIGDSYAQTLATWRQNFMARTEEVRQQGFDERFIRMWEFYLCYCEGGFRERAISNVQLLLTCRDNRRQQWLPN